MICLRIEHAAAGATARAEGGREGGHARTPLEPGMATSSNVSKIVGQQGVSRAHAHRKHENSPLPAAKEIARFVMSDVFHDGTASPCAAR